MTHADVVFVGELFDQMMIMSREESTTSNIISQLFYNTISDCCSVKSGRAATQFIHEHKRVLGRMMQDRSCLAKLKEKCTLAL